MYEREPIWFPLIARSASPTGLRVRLHAQVGFLDLFGREELATRALLDHDPRLEHVAAVRDLERFMRVLLDQQDRGALRVDLADDREDRLDEDRRQTERGLVQQQHLRSRHQRAAHRKHLLLAAGEGARDLVPALLQPRKKREHALHIGRYAGFVVARVGTHDQVVENAHPREQSPALGRLPDPELDDSRGPCAGDVLAVERDLPRVRMHQARDGAQRGGLAGAVGPDEGDDLALLDLDRHPAQGLDAPVEGVDAFQLEQGHQADLPRYASITRTSLRTSSGGPSAIFSPWSRTTIRSEIPITTFISCSIRKTVMPRARIFLTSCISSTFSWGVNPPAGPSSRRSFGSVASARAISSRRCCPYGRLRAY